jgi:hypothetical protein
MLDERTNPTHVHSYDLINAQKMNEQTVSQRIKILIKALKLSSRAFSTSLDVPDATTRNYIDGRSKPGYDYLEKVARKYPQISITWLLTGEGEMQADQAEEPRAVYQTKTQVSGINVGHNAGTVAQHFASTAECERELAVVQKENEQLRSQLADKERIIQIQEQQSLAATIIMDALHLELHLRQLGLQHGVGTAKQLAEMSPNDVNAALAKAGVYKAAQQKQVAAWLALRNRVAHSAYTDLSMDQVKGMHQWVMDFLNQVQ